MQALLHLKAVHGTFNSLKGAVWKLLELEWGLNLMFHFENTLRERRWVTLWEEKATRDVKDGKPDPLTGDIFLFSGGLSLAVCASKLFLSSFYTSIKKENCRKIKATVAPYLVYQTVSVPRAGKAWIGSSRQTAGPFSTETLKTCTLFKDSCK